LAGPFVFSIRPMLLNGVVFTPTPPVAVACSAPLTYTRSCPVAASRVNATWCHSPSLTADVLTAAGSSPAWTAIRPWASRNPQNTSSLPQCRSTPAMPGEVQNVSVPTWVVLTQAVSVADPPSVPARLLAVAT
jgi:hypothetical protein